MTAREREMEREGERERGRAREREGEREGCVVGWKYYTCIRNRSTVVMTASIPGDSSPV